LNAQLYPVESQSKFSQGLTASSNQSFYWPILSQSYTKQSKKQPFAVQRGGRSEFAATPLPHPFSRYPPQLFKMQLVQKPLLIQLEDPLRIQVPARDKSNEILQQGKLHSSTTGHPKLINVTNREGLKNSRKSRQFVIYRAFLDPINRKETVLQPFFGQHPKHVSKDGIRFKTILGKIYNTTRIINKPTKEELMQNLDVTNDDFKFNF